MSRHLFRDAGIAIFCFAVCFSATALTLKIKDSSVIVSGNIVLGDFQKFANVFNGDGKFDEVIFDECYGGLTNEGVQIGELIKAKGLSTVAKGQVQSSCAYAFMAGKIRRFDSGWGTNLILLHAARNENPKNDVAPTVNKYLMPYLVLLSGGKLSTDLIELIRQSTLTKQGVIFFSRKWIFSHSVKVFYCAGYEASLEKCTTLPGRTALESGIVTQ